MRWKYFTQVKQPDDETRYQLALFNIPAGKEWTTDDLHDPEHPIYFEIALRLLYNKLGDSQSLHVGIFTHIHHLVRDPMRRDYILGTTWKFIIIRDV